MAVKAKTASSDHDIVLEVRTYTVNIFSYIVSVDWFVRRLDLTDRAECDVVEPVPGFVFDLKPTIRSTVGLIGW